MARRPGQPGEPLTQRQLQILRLVADGNTNNATGRAVAMSVDAVKTELRTVFEKLQARDRAHAVHLGHLAGLIDCREPA